MIGPALGAIDMHKRYESNNIPIEILRTFIAVIDAGSYTKAGEWLNLSQPAISAQIGRLRRILQGEVFVNGPGSPLTSRGATALSYARRIVAMNDQLITTAGPKPAPRQLVIGLPRWYAHDRLIELIKTCSRVPIAEKLMFRCGGHAEFVPDLNAGTIDVGCLCNVSDQPGRTLAEWSEPTYWVKARSLTLDARNPVPLIGWPGSLGERFAGKLLTEAQIPYVIEFTSADHASRKAAVAAGLGLMVMVEGAMTPDMEIARESFLPTPPMIKAGIYAREGLNVRRVAPLVRILTEFLRPRLVPRLVAVRPARQVPAKRSRRRSS